MLRRTYPNRNGAMLLGVHFARLNEVFTGLDVHGYVMIPNDDCTLGTSYNRERKVRKSEPVCVCVGHQSVNVNASRGEEGRER